MGKHERHLNFMCHDEARAILAALDGADPGEIPTYTSALTLSARQRGIARRTPVPPKK